MHILFAASFRKGNFADFIYHEIKRMGHEITWLTPVDCPYADSIKTRPDVDVAAAARDMPQKPDIFLFTDTSEGIAFLPRGVAECDIPTAFWALDNHLNLRWHKEYCALFDYAFFTQYDRMVQTRRFYGYPHLRWLAYCCDPQAHAGIGVERDIDVGHVGGVNSDRIKFFAALERQGVTVTTTNIPYFGRVGPFYSRCKIVLNVSARYDLNMRSFEAPAAGALVIGQKSLDSGFYRIFTPGVNCDVHWFDDAAAVVKKYLADDELRRRMAEAGKTLVLGGHTYRHRLDDLLTVCAGGITERRTALRGTWQAHLKMALTLWNRQFNQKQEAFLELKKACARNSAGTAAYLARYGLLRAGEKLEKLRVQMGKAPV
ncbi:MAG: glycosyltransferase [Nitrospinae bacterium]|nr:glycosyltransferase [Nitrospinota bacterium]